jgi:multiple sugar transport system substrate-binding protein
MNKKLALAFGAMVVAAFGLAATQAQGNKVVVWFHTGQGGERDALEATIKSWNSANPSTPAELVLLPGGTYGDQVNAAALANKLPCVLDFDGPFVYNYAWTGKLIPIDKYVDAKTKADFLPSIIRQGTYNGKLYSLGQFDSGLALWGNKALLEKAGIAIPKTLKEAWNGVAFENALRKLKAGGLQYPLDMKFNYGVGEWFTYGFSPILQSFGGDLINRKGYQTANGVLNGASAVRGMTYFQRMVKNYVNTRPAGDSDFAEGRAALSYVGHWTYNDYKKALGNNLVLIPMPRFGAKAVTGSGSWNWGISSDCENPDLAAKVLLHINSTDEIVRITDANGAVPARKSAVAKSKLYSKNSPLELFVDQHEANVSLERPVTPAYPSITAAFAQAVNNIVAGNDVKAELDAAVKKIDLNIQDNRGYPVK